MSRPKVIVVGAGIAGLSAADQLRRADVDVEVFEASASLGGRAGTPSDFSVDHQGQTYRFPDEHGVHGVWRQYRNLRRLMHEHGVDGLMCDSLSQELLFRDPQGRLETVEISDVVRLSRLPEPLCYLGPIRDPAFLRDLLRTRIWPYLRAGLKLSHAFGYRASESAPYRALSAEAFVADWPPLLRALFTAFAHSAFFQGLDNCSLAAFLECLQFYLIGDKRNATFDLLRQDTGAMVDGIADGLRAGGVKFRLGESVSQLVVDRGHVGGVVSNGQKIPAAAVVVAVDPPAFRRVVYAQNERYFRGIALPQGTPSIVVRLLFAQSPRMHHGFTGLAAGAPFTAYFWLHRFSRAFEVWHEQTGGSAVECHLYADRGDAVVDDPDEAIVQRVADGVNACWSGLRGHLVHGQVRRNPPTHSAFIPAEAPGPTPATSIQGLSLAGDWIEPRYSCFYMERATMTGIEAARIAVQSVGQSLRDLLEPLAPHPSGLCADAFHRVVCRAGQAGILPSLRS